MNRERLEEMVKMLKGVPEARFNINVYAYLTVTCGTVACALGHAALHPPFVAAGFKMEGEMPTFGDLTGIMAGAAFLGIDIQDAERLFGPIWYDERDGLTKPADVIARIEELLGKP